MQGMPGCWMRRGDIRMNEEEPKVYTITCLGCGKKKQVSKLYRCPYYCSMCKSKMGRR